MNYRDVHIGDIIYMRHSGSVLKGVILEVNTVHSTVLLEIIDPYGAGNIGAHLDQVYQTEYAAIQGHH